MQKPNDWQFIEYGRDTKFVGEYFGANALGLDSRYT